MTTLCAHSCVGRIRYVGVFLYDAERISLAASAKNDREVYPAHLDILLDPQDPEVRKEAASQGIADNILDAAARSPVFKLAKAWKLALPLHPEFRTLPMVWYVPPLSPLAGERGLSEGEDEIDRMRIPVRYLANLLTAGDEKPVRLALGRLSAVRKYMRSVRVEGKPDGSALEGLVHRMEKKAPFYADLIDLVAARVYSPRSRDVSREDKSRSKVKNGRA